MDILLQRHKDFKVRHDLDPFTPASPKFSLVKHPVLDIRGLVVHRDETLILDRLDRLDWLDWLDWRVQRGAG